MTARLETALLGREADLGRLAAAIAGDRPIAVIGEAGVGKTTLVRAAAASARRTIHEGGGYATLAWRPYFAVSRAIGLRLAGDVAVAARRVESSVGPDLLFIDDLHWVDRSSRAVLELVAGRVGLAVAIRTGGEETRAAIDLARACNAELLYLDGVAPDAAAAIARRARPELSAPDVDRIVRRGGGNPMLIEELARRGAEPSSLARAIAGQLDDLAPNERQVVELLTVADRALPVDELGPAVGTLVALRLVERRGDMIGLRHALFGEVTRASLPRGSLARLHAQLADPRFSPAPLERARHLAGAGRGADAARLALEHVDAIAEPRDRAAFLAIAADAAPAARSPGLRLRAARILDEASDWLTIEHVLGPLATGTAEERAESESIQAHAAFALGDAGAARAHLEAANGLAVDPSSHAAARRAIETATLLVNLDGHVERAIAVLAAARPAFDADDDAAADIDVLHASIALLATGMGDQKVVESGLEAAFSTGRYRTATDRARVIQYLLLIGKGTRETLEFLLEQRSRFDVARVGTVALEFHADAVVAAVMAGRLDLGLTLADELLEEPAPPRPRQMAEIHRARALFLLGRFDDAAAVVAAVQDWASSDYFGRAEVLACQAELAFWSGQPLLAVELAQAACAIPPPVPFGHVRTLVMAAWARFELGADPGSGFEFPLPPLLAGADPELLGLRAWYAGDLAAAATAFEAAAGIWAGFEETRRLWCRWAAAECRRRDGDSDAAIAALQAALRDTTAIGFDPLAARVRRSLRLAGVRVAPLRATVSPRTGLTARERELVALVEGGLTNVEIARRLGLGRPTVARILASAMTKLGVSSRTQLAAHGPT